ncbi:amidohydrolase family protein [Caballeronia sp. LZ034LL]|uniref:amidohydrolase family protein n=1 Tax=Caballeronia sp. LZ034LL TaxID=3038567 RepID=UPI0028552820|nr:amidohydrolase family protein [Caballeronia sp. LZ034LL]MDR5836178.1 amidohydrolase family protein [Caballeronia sp. LZ034LL]
MTDFIEATLSPRRPRFTLPRGACDTHCHVIGPARSFPYAASRPYTPEEETDKTVLSALHERLGVDRAVIVQATVYATDNRIVLDAIADRPHARRGVALVDTSISDAALQALHDGGIRAVRFGFVRQLWTPPDPAEFQALMHRIAGLGWHVLLHLDATALVELQTMLDALPVPFLIDHMGRIDAGAGLDQPGFAQLLEWAQRDHCWIKLSALDRISATGAPFVDAAPFARALLEASPERVLWGTDYPHPNPRHPVLHDATLVDVLPLCGDARALHKLLVANPARLYGFVD